MAVVLASFYPLCGWHEVEGRCVTAEAIEVGHDAAVGEVRDAARTLARGPCT